MATAEGMAAAGTIMSQSTTYDTTTITQTAQVGKGAPRFFQIYLSKNWPINQALPVIMKGVQDPDDAEVALQAGAKGIWVPNHGGRQLNGGHAAFNTLAGITERVNKRVPIIFDSGVRRGSHVFKARASDADVVVLARPRYLRIGIGRSARCTIRCRTPKSRI